MVSRRSAKVIAEAYARAFAYYSRSGWYIDRDGLYDFLYENDYEPWFCNSVRRLFSERDVKEWIMQLHTGETQFNATKDWTWEGRRKLGQQYLRNTAEDILNHGTTGTSSYRKDERTEKLKAVLGSLELDGYTYRDGALLLSEADVLDVEEEVGVLQRLYRVLGLENPDLSFEMLRLSEEHYLSGRWSDCISNSRKFLESALAEVAKLHSKRFKGCDLTLQTAERPVFVRQYLEDEKLIEKKEKEAIEKIYGLLSHTGNHPYMAENDQARLLRQLSLTVSQFVMLRLEGRIESATSKP
jgi:hypothetical protein